MRYYDFECIINVAPDVFSLYVFLFDCYELSLANHFDTSVIKFGILSHFEE